MIMPDSQGRKTMTTVKVKQCFTEPPILIKQLLTIKSQTYVEFWVIRIVLKLGIL